MGGGAAATNSAAPPLPARGGMRAAQEASHRAKEASQTAECSILAATTDGLATSTSRPAPRATSSTLAGNAVAIRRSRSMGQATERKFDK
jgi:hypothetical protein